MTFYNIDTTPFNTRALICFDQAGLDAILHEYEIDYKLMAFDAGVAETHYISDENTGIIVLIFDLNKFDHDEHYRYGVIAHEAYHATCRIFQHIGEKVSDVGEEVFAYTLEHMVKQMSVAVGKELNARKTSRSKTKQARKGKGWPKLQVDQLSDGRARPNSAAQQQVLLCGTEDAYRKAVSTSAAGIQAANFTGLPHDCDPHISGN